MTIDEMKAKKRELGLTNLQVAERSGVPLGTVQKVLSGGTRAPRYDTLRALEKAFQEEESGRSAGKSGNTAGHIRYKLPRSHDSSCIREPAPSYAYKIPGTVFRGKRQGEFTLEDYLAWPEEQRIELIDGVIYDMSAPTYYHQIIAGHIYYQLIRFADRGGHGCTPFISPADVQLDRDLKTVVQPDVFAVCDPDRLKEMLKVTQGKRLYGAPDFVVEVLSPSTRSKDVLIKAGKYQRAGVKEYWTVDAESKTVLVYIFTEGDLKITPYTFDDHVPVSVSGGECRIDFPDIRRRLESFQF